MRRRINTAAAQLWPRGRLHWLPVLLLAAAVALNGLLAAPAAAQRVSDNGFEWLKGRWGVGTSAACATHYYRFGDQSYERVRVTAGRRSLVRRGDVEYDAPKAGQAIFASGHKPAAGAGDTFVANRQGADRVRLDRPALLNGKEKPDTVSLVRCATSADGWLYGRWGQRIGQLDTCGACPEGDRIANYNFESGRVTWTRGQTSRACTVVEWPRATYPSVDAKGARVDLGGGRRLVVTRTAKPDEVIIHTDGKKADQAHYYRCQLEEAE